jgi:hypothetical protein
VIYELRTYLFHPASFPAYIAAVERPEVAKALRPYLKGFWASESGMLNRVLHLLEYRDRTERAEARAKRAALPAMQLFYREVIPMVREQRSVICEGRSAEPSGKKRGAYHRLAITLAPGANGEAVARTLETRLAEAFEVVASLRVRLLEQPTAPIRELVFMLATPSGADLADTFRDPALAAIETDLWTPLGLSPLQ